MSKYVSDVLKKLNQQSTVLIFIISILILTARGSPLLDNGHYELLLHNRGLP